MAKQNSLTKAVTEAVERSVDAAEEIHRSVARLPFDVMRRAELIGKAADDVERVQERSIHAVYDLVRGINREVGRMAERIMTAPEPEKRSRPKPAPARTAAAA